MNEPQVYNLMELSKDPDKTYELATNQNAIVPISMKGLALLAKSANIDGVTAVDLMKWATTALSHGANPYTDECGLMKSQGQIKVWVAAQVRMRKAQAQPDYNGFSWGYITSDMKRHEPGRASTANPADVIGAWGEVFREGRAPYYHEVFLSEFKKETSSGKGKWEVSPITMLAKVIRDQAHKFAYADVMGNLNTADELQSYNTLEVPNCQTPARADRRKPAQDVRVTDSPAGTTEQEPAGISFSNVIEQFVGITGVEGDKDQVLAMFQVYAADALACPADDVTEEKCTAAMLLKIQSALNAMEKK